MFCVVLGGGDDCGGARNKHPEGFMIHPQRFCRSCAVLICDAPGYACGIFRG